VFANAVRLVSSNTAMMTLFVPLLDDKMCCWCWYSGVGGVVVRCDVLITRWILIGREAATQGRQLAQSCICNLQSALHRHTHNSLAAALWRRATSGLGETPAGAQLSILVVIFLFFHYGSVSSGCNRRAINQHYFHISADVEKTPASLPASRGPALSGPRPAG